MPTATILVVDDEPDIVESVRDYLGAIASNLRVIGATSPKQAMRLLASTYVNVVCSDHLMPSMDGIEFLDFVRRKQPHAKRILMTGIADQDALARAADAEIDLILRKPIDLGELRAVVVGSGDDVGLDAEARGAQPS